MDIEHRQAYFERAHRLTDSARLDRYARAAGSPSGIGRMSHITDEALDVVCKAVRLCDGARVLDLGAGRGFLGRWFCWRGIRTEYVGVDFSPTAVRAATDSIPDGTIILANIHDDLDIGLFDFVFAIESTGDGYVDNALAQRMLTALKPNGTGIGTVVGLRFGFKESLEISLQSITHAGGKARVLNLTSIVCPYVTRICRDMYEDRSPNNELQDLVRKESAQFLEAIRSGTYGYAAVIATHG